MTDRRLLKSNGRVADVSLRGQVEAERFVTPTPMQVGSRVIPLLSRPWGARDRELVKGEVFHVLDEADDAPFVFGFADRDGYCGWIFRNWLKPRGRSTHRVAARQTYDKERPELKTTDRTGLLSYGSLLDVRSDDGDWSEVVHPSGQDSDRAVRRYVPSVHLVPIDHVAADPMAEARKFLGTPYLWGGNSGSGIDCSGLVQAAFLACGVSCPGDSDLQEAMDGTRLSGSDALRSGDLIFWKGHVAMATGPETMIHANAHHMMVVEEPIAPAIARIAATDTGPVTSRLRVL